MNKSAFHGGMLGVLLLGVLPPGGCVVGPNYPGPPPVEFPNQFGQAAAAGVSADGSAAELANWWAQLGDTRLTSLVERALAANLDVELAGERVREARAARGGAFGQLFPAVDAAAGYSRNYGSRNAQPGAGPINGAPINFPGFGKRAYDLFQTGFEASWEVDVFGGIRRGVEAADAELSAQEAVRRAVLVTVAAETALTYVELRGLQAQRAVAERNVRDTRELLRLTRIRQQAGLGSELDVQRAESLLAGVRAQIPLLEAGIARRMHRLGVLLGKPPMTLVAELREPSPLPNPVATPRVGLPVELIRRRPDIARSERRLAAANARIGQATADLLPKFKLAGSWGLQSGQGADLFNPGSWFGYVGPSVRWTIFDAGRILSNIEVQDSLSRQAATQYRQTVLTAMEEVETALADYGQQRQNLAELRESLRADRRASELAEERFVKGVADFLEVLDSRRTLYATEERLTSAEQQALGHLIGLYRALGGGWESVPAVADAR